MIDVKNDFDAAQDIAPAAVNKTNIAPASGVDLAGYDGAMACFDVGAITDGTHTPALQESDDNSTFTDVAAADLVGSFSAVSNGSGENAVQRVGYIGTKRYIAVKVTVSGAPATGGFYTSTIIRGHAKQGPLS